MKYPFDSGIVPAAPGEPGARSSSPEHITVTTGRRATRTLGRSSAAASATFPGVSRAPLRSGTAPSARSAPRRRTHAPARGASRKVISSPLRAASSCGAIASAPGGSRAPVKIRHAVPGWSAGSARPAALSPRTGSLKGPLPAKSAEATA